MCKVYHFAGDQDESCRGGCGRAIELWLFIALLKTVLYKVAVVKSFLDELSRLLAMIIYL